MTTTPGYPSLVAHIPDDTELLAAIGRVSIRHGFLDLILKRTVKTLADLTVEEVDRLIHDVWAEVMDGPPVLIGTHAHTPVPSTAEVNKLADEIYALAGSINHARFPGGFLHDALQKLSGSGIVDDAKND